VASAAVILYLRRRRHEPAMPAALTPEEQRRLGTILADDGSGRDRSA
jgi:hypothetical protein